MRHFYRGSTNVAADRILVRVAIFILGCILLHNPAAHAQSWTPANGPFGAVAILASGGSTLYAAEEGGTIFVLNDDEKGWTRKKVANNTAMITALTASGDMVYAGTADGRIYISGDRGTTWERFYGGGYDYPIVTILAEGDTIFFARDGHSAMDDGVIYATYNGGLTWTPLRKGLPDVAVLKVVRSRGILIAEVDASPWIYRSSDNGATWAEWSAEIGKRKALTSIDGDLYIALSILVDGKLSPSIYRSTDAGASWKMVMSNAAGSVSGIVTSGDTIVVSTAVDSNGLVNTTTDRTRPAVSYYPAGEVRKILSMVRHKGDLYIGTHRGVYRSSFGAAVAGNRWEPVNAGLTNVHVTGLAYDGGILYAATTMGPRMANGGGMFSTSDLGVTWREECKGLRGENYKTVAMKNSKGLIGGDSGLALQYVLSDLWEFHSLAPDYARQPNIKAVFITNKGAMLVGRGEGVLRGDVMMTAWKMTGKEQPDRQPLSFTEQDDDVYVGTSGAGIYRSQDDGINWKQVTGFPLDGAVKAMAADSRDIYAGTAQGVYHSADRGVSWTLGADGLSGKETIVNALVVHGSTVYAGTDDGLFGSTDKGASWSSVDPVFDGIRVTSFAVGANNVFAGTDGHGVFHTVHPLSAPERDDISRSVILANHPNPWSGETVIGFTLDAAAQVSISLHDPLGRRVRTVLNERREAGEHSVRMDDTGLPSGVYYYTLHAGELIGTGRMIVTGGSSR